MLFPTCCSLALLTSFPCPAAVPPGLGVGILTLAEFSLRVAPGRLWERDG